MELSKARFIANGIKNELEQAGVFTRIEIAGSIRREKPEVKDIEIVAAPKYVQVMDMFGEPKGYVSNAGFITNLVDMVQGEKYIKNGDRYKQILLKSGINLDLFLVFPPAQWGVIYTIRTGPWGFSKKIVTPEKWGGYLQTGCEVKDGALWDCGRTIDTPEEKDFFEYLTIDWTDPVIRVE